MTIVAAEHNLTGASGVDKGRYFSRSFAFTDSNGDPIDLTSYTVQADARTGPDKGSKKILDFTASHNDDGGIVTIAYDDSAAGIKANSGYYDIVLIDVSGNPDTWVYGEIDFKDRPTEVV